MTFEEAEKAIHEARVIHRRLCKLPESQRKNVVEFVSQLLDGQGQHVSYSVREASVTSIQDGVVEVLPDDVGHEPLGDVPATVPE